jgi:hypothetical protein
MWRFTDMVIFLFVFSMGFAAHVHAQTKTPDIGFFINDRMEGRSTHCKVIALKTYDAEGPLLLKGGEKSTCDVTKSRQTDFIIRCGSYSIYDSTAYDIFKPGATVVLVMFTKPEMLLKELEIEYPVPFDENYQKRSLFWQARRDLSNYWLSLPIEARKQVSRAYAVVDSPSDGNVLGWSIRVE